MPPISNGLTLAIAAAALSFSAAACAHKDMDLDCRVSGVKYMSGAVDEAALCDVFASGLGEARAQVTAIHIEMTQRGAINARISKADGESLDMGMDVMDRPIRLSDIETLAKALASQF